MARNSLSSIISHVRLLIGDTAGSPQVWSDDDIQTFLDNHRQDVKYAQLYPVTDYSTGVAQYLEWRAGGGWWDDDATLTDAQYQTLTPATKDLQRGVWVFATHTPDALLSGAAYDVNAAAADVCDAWIGKIKFAYDFTADGSTFHRSQMLDHLQALAVRLRSSGPNGGVRTAQLVRSDLWR